MATTLEQLTGFLDEFDLKYHADEENTLILIGFCCNPKSTYRDEDGEAYVRMVIRIQEDGDFLSVFVPNAWNIDACPHKAAVFEVLTCIPAQYKMLRFDYDPTDGEIRPNIELSLEDSSITSRQFHRMVIGVLQGIQRFDRVIRRAMNSGEVSFADLQDEEEEQQQPASDEIIRLRELAERAGGVEALEKLLGGDTPGEDAA